MSEGGREGGRKTGGQTIHSWKKDIIEEGNAVVKKDWKVTRKTNQDQVLPLRGGRKGEEEGEEEGAQENAVLVSASGEQLAQAQAILSALNLLTSFQSSNRCFISTVFTEPLVPSAVFTEPLVPSAWGRGRQGSGGEAVSGRGHGHLVTWRLWVWSAGRHLLFFLQRIVFVFILMSLLY